MSHLFVLDLGSAHVRAAALRVGPSGEMDVDAFAQVPSVGMTKGAISDLELATEAIVQVVEELRENIAIPEDADFVVSVNGSHIDGTNSQGLIPIFPNTRAITRDDVYQVINHSRQAPVPAARETVQAIPREFRIDGKKGIVRPIGRTGGRLEVVTHIITAESSHVQTLARAARIAGIRASELVPAALAAGLGVVGANQAAQGAVVVDIGAETTKVAIFSGGVIAYEAVLPLGSNAVTSDLAALLRCSLAEAERLKTQEATALSAKVDPDDSVEVMQSGQELHRHLQRKVLCEIVESRMREILSFVKLHVDRSGLSGLLPGGVILTGGGSQLPGLPQLCETILPQMKARGGVPSVAGTFSDELKKPEFATLVGLARFMAESATDEEFAPVDGEQSWTVKITNVLMGKLKSNRSIH